MQSQWTSHLTDTEEKNKFKAYLHGSKGIFDRMNEIVDAWERDLTSTELSLDQYESPSWAARQADINGSRRYLRKMKQLITLDQKEN